MTYFMRDGSSYLPTNEADIDLHTSLPPGNFYIKKNAMSGQLYFSQISSFDISHKIYGAATDNSDRILNTFQDRAKSTGVLLTGEKGSGKTLLAKMLAVKAAKLNMPTIIINFAWCGEDFNQLMQSIEQPCLVLFDEFEKVYKPHEQESILTLLDGVFQSKKLFILTCNDPYRVDEHMRNRPGRLFYMINFKGLDKAFIVEYCEERLNNKSYIDDVCTIASMFDQFNFDMLSALVEEVNRYGESPQVAIGMLNAKPFSRYSIQSRYSVDLYVDGKKWEAYPTIWDDSPVSGERTFNVRGRDAVTVRPSTDDDEWDNEMQYFNFDQGDLCKVENNAFTYINDKRVRVVFTKIVNTSSGYMGLL